MSATKAEIEQLLDRNESILAKWKGNPGYTHGLMIEQVALRLLLNTLYGVEVPYGG